MLIDESINEDEEILFYVERKRKGEDFSSIRKELISKGYSEDKVASMMREIEDLVIESYDKKAFRIRPMMIGGFSLGMVGLTLIIFGKTGILSFGLLFGGLTLLVSQRQKRSGRIEQNKWTRH